MSEGRRSKWLWAAWMGGGGLVIAAVVYVITGSFGWALVALLAAGPILNAVAQLLTQPSKAVTRATRTGGHRRPMRGRRRM